ncbi:ester cyclase [bacterium]|nr:ester cyclase [bacterium]
MISIRFGFRYAGLLNPSLNPRFSRSSKLFLVCIMLIAFGGVLQAISQEPVPIMAEEPVPIMVEQLAVGEAAGAEDVAIDAQGRIYGGMADGRIIRYQPDGSQPEVFATIEEGRPLGLDFDPDGNLIVADANKGLLSISPDGAITVLSTEYDGVPYGLPNDVDVAEDGTIYFSDSSFKISLAEALTELQESPGPYGRLLKYDPETQTTELVLGDLWFANGVAVSPDQSFVLVVEMAENRIARYWLTGPDAGQSDIFVENLPVWPDGVSSNGQDTFWVAVLGEGLALGLHQDGNVVHNLHPLYPSGEPYAAVASVEEHEGMIYLGHLEDDFIPRLSLEKIATVETLEANKAIRRRLYEEVWNQGNLDVIDEIYSPGRDWGAYGNAEGLKQYVTMTRAAFPDIHITIEDIVAEGDMVATRISATGTHTGGEFMGIPPTGAHGTRTGISIAHIVDGRIQKVWENYDDLGMMQQLGVITPGRPAPENYMWSAPSEVTGDPGTPEENKAIALRIVEELWNQHNVDLVDEFFSTDLVGHNPALSGLYPEVGTESMKQAVADHFTALPDFHVTVQDTLAEGDKLIQRWTVTGTHLGEFMGIPPTGAQVTFSGITINRFADGKIVEMWWAYDALGMMQQLTPPLPDTEANKAVFRRLIEEVWNNKNLDLIDEILDESLVEMVKKNVSARIASVPDVHITIEDQIAEGDMVATRLTATGTHTGEFMGIPPTNVFGAMTVISISRIVDGKIVENRDFQDDLGLMQQWGIMPTNRVDYTWGDDSEVTGDAGAPEENKAITRHLFEELWNQQNPDVLDETASADLLTHSPVEPNNPIRGLEANKQATAIYYAAFPDLHVTIDNLFAEADKVVLHWTTTGTHQGELAGIPPTGKKVIFTGATIYRFADGKAVENWWAWDALGLMQQLTAPTVDTEANKAILLRVFNEVYQGDIDVIDEICAPDYIYRRAGEPDLHGPEGFKQFVAGVLATFSDIQFTIDDMIAAGDKVTSRWTYHGTHQPTGKQVTGTGITISRLANGKLKECRTVGDRLATMQQLGVIPSDREDYTWGVPSEVTGEPGDPEENKAIVLREYEEVWHQGKLDVLDEIYATDFINHNPYFPEVRDIESYKQFFVAGTLVAFPDFHVTVEDIFVEGDKVVSRWTVTGTHEGGGPFGIPTTGKQMMWTGITINRFADGKVVEAWWIPDMLGLFQQLGVIPPMVKDFSNVFFMPLTPGLNMISLPLESQTPYTARSFAEKLSATAVITLDEARQKFVGFTLDAPDDGFAIKGGKGYIVNVTEGGMVAFTGAAWTRPPMSAPEVRDFGYPAQTDGAWAFVVSGRFVDDSADSLKKDGYLVTVRNTRTNAVTTDVIRSRYFAAAFADLNRKNVVQTGDRLELQLRNQAGEMVSDTLTYTVTTETIRQAFMPLTLKNIEIPRQSLLLPNYPNPFNPETWIPYQIRESADVMIWIYSTSGQLVRTLDLGQRAAGFYLGHTRAAHWDGHNDAGEKVASGIYFYQIKAGDFFATRRMVIVK